MAFQTIQNPTVLSDGNQLMAAAQSTVVNLVTSSAPSLIVFAVPAEEPGTFTTVSVSMTSSELINALDAAAVRAMNVPNYEQYNGKYDINTARLMSVYGSWIRGGADVGEYYIIGQQDVYNLLAQDPSFQQLINSVSGKNGIPLVQEGVGTFLAPSKDAFSDQVPLDSVVTYDEVEKPEGGYDFTGAGEDDMSKWWLWGGIAAAGVVGYGLFSMVKKGR